MVFIDLNKDNWKECAALTDTDDVYIASNLYSIAESQFYDKASSKAIVVDEQMVGYTMYGEDEDDPGVFFIHRFMIGRKHRRKGYGSMAFQKLIETGIALGYNRIETSTEAENEPMQKLLEKNGFRSDGEIRDDEIVYFLQK